jgi:hypothetical protein
MVAKRRGGAIALALALLVGACERKSVSPTGGAGMPDRDAAAFQECSSICRRPSDCAQAFPDDGICPPGFLCALRFTCSD